MTISKKDQERLIDAISDNIGRTISILVLINVMRVIVTGGTVDAPEMLTMVKDSVKRTLSRYQITEKPN